MDIRFKSYLSLTAYACCNTIFTYVLIWNVLYILHIRIYMCTCRSISKVCCSTDLDNETGHGYNQKQAPVASRSFITIPPLGGVVLAPEMRRVLFDFSPSRCCPIRKLIIPYRALEPLLHSFRPFIVSLSLTCTNPWSHLSSLHYTTLLFIQTVCCCFFFLLILSVSHSCF